jgi:hypothetical protein
LGRHEHAHHNKEQQYGWAAQHNCEMLASLSWIDLLLEKREEGGAHLSDLLDDGLKNSAFIP